MVVSHPRPNDLGAAATLIRSRQSRCRIQRVTLSVVFELSGAGKARAEDFLRAALVGAPVVWKAHMEACWVADDGQIDQAVDDVVAEYSRLPAGRAFIDGLDGFGFDDGDVTVFCGTGDSHS